jgi:hypothetical protein
VAAASGSPLTRATSRPIATWTAGSDTPPDLPVSTSTCAGAIAPGPSAVFSTFSPRTDCGDCGIPAVAPGVSWSQATGTARARSSAAVTST